MLKDFTKRDIMEERKVLLNEAESIARMGSWKWTEQNDELMWSEGLYKLYEKNPDEPIQWSTFLENVVPEDLPELQRSLLEVKTNKSGSTITYRICRNNHTHYFELIIKPHFKQNIDILGAVLDITDRITYENQAAKHFRSQTRIIHELYEKENRYRTLFERSIDPIFLITDNFSLLDVNESFLRLFDYSDTETQTLTISDLFADQTEYNYFKKTLTDLNQISNFETSLITKKGEKKSCILNCVFIPNQIPENRWYQGILHDLTLHKRANTDLLIAERLSLTGKIARTIAHEVRNPLTNLNLALDQLRAELENNNESVNLYTDIIERNATRIEQLVGELLNSSKPRQPTLELTSINEIVENAISLVIDRMELEQITIELHLDKNLPKILVDNADIQLALVNIMINAVEAMTPGKGILKIYASKEDKRLLLSIADNGKGIPAADLEHLFDPFFTHKHSGMGLGLTSTKNILNSHHARVEVTSELSMGTTFSISFKLPD